MVYRDINVKAAVSTIVCKSVMGGREGYIHVHMHTFIHACIRFDMYLLPFG